MTKTTVPMTLDVDIDLDDIDAADMAEHLRGRGYVVTEIEQGPGSQHDVITEMFYAFRMGREDKALELARRLAQEHTGRIL